MGSTRPNSTVCDWVHRWMDAIAVWVIWPVGDMVWCYVSWGLLYQLGAYLALAPAKMVANRFQHVPTLFVTLVDICQKN